MLPIRSIHLILLFVFTKCVSLSPNMHSERDFEAGKEWQWVPRAGACIPLLLGSEISKSTVVLTVLANLT